MQKKLTEKRKRKTRKKTDMLFNFYLFILVLIRALHARTLLIIMIMMIILVDDHAGRGLARRATAPKALFSRRLHCVHWVCSP